MVIRVPNRPRLEVARRGLQVPSAELRQGLRSAVLRPPTPLARAEVMHDLINEMVTALAAVEAQEVEAEENEVEAESLANVCRSVAEHVERMRRHSGSQHNVSNSAQRGHG